MLLVDATKALKESKCLTLNYDGFSRLVEVHLIGLDKNDLDIMLVWQVSGGSSSGERMGWKTLKLADAKSAALTDVNSEAPRPGYSLTNNAIKVVKQAL